ncbi:hypothetical protein ACFL3B_03675 [Gemmatimonadota bacterium]
MQTVNTYSGGALVFLLLLTPPMEADAQIIGGRIGVTLLEDMTKMTGGAYVAFPLDGWFSLQPELLYSPKGMSWYLRPHPAVDPNSGQSVYVDEYLYQEYGYLEVPLLATMDVPLTSKLGLSVAAGPSASLRVHCALKRRSVLVSFTGEEVSDTTEVLEGGCDKRTSTNLGFVLGGGAGFGSDRLKFTVDLRHSIDFGQMKNHVFTATIGVGLRR